MNNETNSSMLINPDKNFLNKSFTNLIPPKPAEQIRNQSTRDASKTHNSTNDTKNNANTNLNSSYQKTFSIFSESNYDSNCLTDRSSNNIKEIKVNITTIKRKNNYINNGQQKTLNNDDNCNEIQSNNNSHFSEEEKIKKISYIQKWWKTRYNVIFIQKHIKGYLLRKNMGNIIIFIKSIFRLLFKLVIYNLKRIPQLKFNNKKDIKKCNDKTIKKNQTNNKFNKINNRPLFNESNNSFNNFKLDYLKKIENKKLKVEIIKKIMSNNNPINLSKTKNNYTSITNNKDKFLNKIKKNNKERKEKEVKTITSKDKLIANNIFNIYNNVKKYYENENNNMNMNNSDINYSTANNFFTKNKKNLVLNNNNKNKNAKGKKMVTKGSMKNIKEKLIINKNNNINANININNNPKTDRSGRYDNNRTLNKHSILYLLKLKKAFIFWYDYLTKKKIIQKLKLIKNLQTPSNTKKTLSIYTTKKKEDLKSGSITTKKINLSNSLINLKKKKITPQKIKINDNIKQNIVFTNYNKKFKIHSSSVENNNNSILNLQTPKCVGLNRTMNAKKDNKFQTNKKNKFSSNLCNNSVIVVSQYDRNNETKKKEMSKYSDSKNTDVNENKKIYYFYAIINLIDKHNKRKKIKNYFNVWKKFIRYSRNFINNNKIEEKIISFKSLKSPLKNNLNNNQFNQNNSLNKNNNFNNYNCQTETDDKACFNQIKEIPDFNRYDLLTPNPYEKSMHPNLYKTNFKSSKIVYQKKLLIPKKMRNESMKSLNINDEEEDRNMNMTLVDNNKEINLLNQSTGNAFYSTHTCMFNNNDLNNSVYIKRINFDNSVGKINAGRINKSNIIEETEVCFTPSTEVNTLKNSFVVEKKNIYDDVIPPNKINVNVVENYNNVDLKKDNIENNKYQINNEKRITTKQIKIREKNRTFKNNSYSLEYRNDNIDY